MGGRAGLWRGLLLLLGAAGTGLLAAWIPLLDKTERGFALATEGWHMTDLPTLMVLSAMAAAGLGGVGLVLALLHDRRLRGALGWCATWMRTHRLLSLGLLVVMAMGAVDVYELLYDAYKQQRGLYIYRLREDVQAWLLLAATIMAGLAVSAARGEERPAAGGASRLGRWASGPWAWVVAMATPLLLAGAMCYGALDGIPHFSDSLTYLMQGRMLYHGMLSMPRPEHHELFQHSLFFVVSPDGLRFFGKYPVGWPAIVGLFDALSIGFLANATLAGLVAVLTGLVARQFASRRVAGLAAGLMGVSPWLWFHGSNFASHTASTAAVLAFVFMFLRCLKLTPPTPGHGDKSTAALPWGWALGAGLALGLAVLVRPFDAAMFALPAVPVVLYRQWKQPRRWLALGTLVAVGAMVGVAVYLAVNHATMGSFRSPYTAENRWDKDWNSSPPVMAARFFFQWAEVNGRFPGWGVGGMTVGVVGMLAAWRRGWNGGLTLVLAGTGLFFAGCTAFQFTNVWWGPRWLLPVTPALAILAAYALDQALHMAEDAADAGRRRAGQLAVLLLLGGVMVGLTAQYGGQWHRHRIMPPHSVSAAAKERVEAMGLRHVVVGMPPAGRKPPLDARAGMVFMTVPLEANEVVYVRAVPGWREAAEAMFPGRKMYELVADPAQSQGFAIVER